MRDEIKRFAEAMELKMQEHDPDKGDSWKRMHFNYMDKKLLEEVTEYFLTHWDDVRFISELCSAIIKVHSPKEANKESELEDIGVVAMMHWNILKEDKE